MSKAKAKFYFNPLPRKEGDDTDNREARNMQNFNPLPRKEGDDLCYTKITVEENFNPLPRKEGDRWMTWRNIWALVFQSTPS